MSKRKSELITNQTNKQFYSDQMFVIVQILPNINVRLFPFGEGLTY